MPLRETDLKIIDALTPEGRMKFKDIARVVGVSDTEVRRRLTELTRLEALKVVPVMNVKYLSFSLAVVCLECQNINEMSRFLDLAGVCPRILSVVTCTGAYNLVVKVFAEDAGTLRSMVEKEFRLNPAFKRVDVSVGTYEKPAYIQIRKSLKNMDATPCGKGCIECFFYQRGYCLGCPQTKFYRGHSSILGLKRP